MANTSPYDGPPPSDPTELTPVERDLDHEKSGVRKKRKLRPGNLALSILTGTIALTCYIRWARWVATNFNVGMPDYLQIPTPLALAVGIAALSYVLLNKKSAD